MQGQGSLVAEPLQQGFALAQNYPNPFNPTTDFEFSIPKEDYVSLKVYNVNGQEVAVVLDEYRNTGEHLITFDASNLAAGTYFYTLTSGKFSETKKFTLVK